MYLTFLGTGVLLPSETTPNMGMKTKTTPFMGVAHPMFFNLKLPNYGLLFLLFIMP
jgi:hypothetical protein